MKAGYGCGTETARPLQFPTTHAFRAVISLRAFSPGKGITESYCLKAHRTPANFTIGGRRSSEEVSRADTLRLHCIYDVSIHARICNPLVMSLERKRVLTSPASLERDGVTG